MKKNILKGLAICALLVGMISCEVITGGINEEDIIGTWTIDDATVELKVGVVSLSDFLINTMMYTQEDADALIGSFELELEEEVGGTIEMKSDNSYVLNSSDASIENGSWAFDADNETLTLTAEMDDPEVLEISKLTSSEIILVLPPESEMMDLDDNGSEETEVTLLIEFYLSK